MVHRTLQSRRGAGRFPVSDHCDGTQFFNPTGIQAKSFWALPRWWWQQAVRRTDTPWPESAPPPQPVRLPGAIAPQQVAVTFIGHATFLLQYPGMNILTDPMFSACAGPFGWAGPRRVRPPAMTLDELPRIDVVLLSHSHYDHLDLPSMRWLAEKRRPQIITTLGNRRWLESRGIRGAEELDWWETHRHPGGFTFTCTPAQHFAARSPWDRCRTLWGGFMIGSGAGNHFFCGDSAWGPHFEAIRERAGDPSLAVLPIGAYEPRWFMRPVHMNPDEAVRAHLALRSKMTIGMHFGTFKLTDEGIDAPLAELAAARERHGVAASAFDVLPFGGTRLLANGGAAAEDR